MKITSIEIVKVETKNKLKAYCNIVIDEAIKIKNIKIIEAKQYIISFPSEKLRFKCKNCLRKNTCDALYCNFCGALLQPQEAIYFDRVHPTNANIRAYIEENILKEYVR